MPSVPSNASELDTESIGLAVVVELLNGYGGTLGIDSADLGGANLDDAIFNSRYK